MRKTKIICTLGPAVDSDEKIQGLILGGMDGARFNFSHGSYEEHQGRIDRVRRVAAAMNANIPLILDTKGPEIRVRDFKEGKVMLEAGQEFTLYAEAEEPGDEHGVAVTYPYLAEDLSIGNNILIDDGLVSMVVERIEGRDIVCRVENPGKVSNHKSINIPSVFIDQPYISEKDRSDILFGIKNDVDFIAASFVRSAEDARKLRKLLDVNGGKNIRIIAKIENPSGVENLDAIVKIVDGIMVARGDMGVEIPYRELPAIQKKIIRTCYENGKIVITATQMLDSMQEHPRPTRAEVSDVANAIYDGTTCIMLSGETAAGKYPLEAVRAMSNIAEYTETQIDYAKRFSERRLKIEKNIINTIAYAAVDASFYLGASAILCMTLSGTTARTLSFYRPSAPIVACVADRKACRQLRLYYGIYPVMAEYTQDSQELRTQTVELAIKSGIVKKDELAVIVTGSVAGNDTITDSMQIAHL